MKFGVLLLGALSCLSSAWAYRVDPANEVLRSANHKSEICKDIVGKYLGFLSQADCRSAEFKVTQKYYDTLPGEVAEKATGYSWTFAKGELACNGSVTLNIKKPYVDNEGRVKYLEPSTKWSFSVASCGSEALNVLKDADIYADNVQQVGLYYDSEFPWEDDAPDAEDEVLASEIPKAVFKKMSEELSLLTDQPDFNWVKTEYYVVRDPDSNKVIGYIGVEDMHNTNDSEDYSFDTLAHLVFDLEGNVVADKTDI
ncbi:MAG: hypothetical protein R3A80_10405 [Bdellovibrionota bacterium]